MNRKEGDKKRKEVLMFLIGIVILLVVIVFLYYILLHREKCASEECFNDRLVRCKRASWINDAEEAIWLYSINGRSKGQCKVNLELITIKKGKLDIGKAEGKSMVCYLPLGIMIRPGEDLARCSGALKEELQDLIIKKMHSYILENLGKINEEITKAI